MELIEDQLIDAIRPVLRSASFASGAFVTDFEDSFSQFLSKNRSLKTIGCSNGTDALHIALRSLGIGNGDEVILPANTFIATAWAPIYCGARPVFVDCDPDTWNICIEDVKRKINSKTKAIIAVHLYGAPSLVPALKEIISEKNIHLIEDCAQSHGAQIEENYTGSFGDLACFSFYPGKNLGAIGEAGAIITQDETLEKTIRCLIDHGSVEKYHHIQIGFNHRMDGIQAAALKFKLNLLPDWTIKRQTIASRYLSEINNSKIKFQKIIRNSSSVYHLFVVQVEDRNDFVKMLFSKGIGTGLHYPTPCHLQPALDHLGYKIGDFPNSEIHAKRCVSLPMFPELTDLEVTRVIEVVNEF